MKNMPTAIYIGKGSEIPYYLAEHEGYLVDAIEPNDLDYITEYLKNDEIVRPSVRDTLEGDARLIMMDINMLDGINKFSNLIDKIVEARLKGEHLENFDDDISKKIIRIIESKGIMNFDGSTNISVLKNSKEYLEDIKLIMDNIGYRVILGDKKFEFIKNYVEQMKKEALIRRKDSRFNTGDNRDLVEPTDSNKVKEIEKESNKEWKPMFVLTSTEELSDRTNSENVRTEYQKLYLMQKLLNDFDIDIDVPAVVNVRSEFDVKLEPAILKNVQQIRDKIKDIALKKGNNENINLEDATSRKIYSIIESFDSSNIDVGKVMAELDIVDIIGIEEIKKINSVMGRIDRIATKNQQKVEERTENTDKQQKKVVRKPRLMIVHDAEEDKELEDLKKDLMSRFIYNSGIDSDKFDMVVSTEEYMPSSFIDPQKMVATLNWLDLFANPNKTDTISIKEALKRAMNMMDVLDVDGSVRSHSLRTALLYHDFLNFMCNDFDWKQVEDILPKESINRYKVSKNEIEDMTRGAYLHDIGKLLNIENTEIMGFAASLQTNSGWITSKVADESRLHHAEIGHSTIEYFKNNFRGNKKFLDYASNMALYHQEYIRDDATITKGYSENGEHKDIILPLEAQYMSIVDVFDAIVSQRNYNSNTTLENTLKIMAGQGGIKILQESEDNPGAFKDVNLDAWCMNNKTKFEFQKGCMSQSQLHFNPILMMGFCQYLQEQLTKEHPFVKFTNDKVQRRDGFRKVVTGIGTINFSKQVIHGEREESNFDLAKLQEDRIIQQVKDFQKLFKAIEGMTKEERKEELFEQLSSIRKDILEATKSMGKFGFSKRILKMLDGKERNSEELAK